MSSIPRIVTVDPTKNVARIMQGALSLLNRQHVLIDVPSFESALAEIGNAPIDLVVTAFDIAGEMTGIDLATQISHVNLDVPVIVLADEHGPRLDDNAVQDVPFQYFVRPASEAFLRGVRVALDGEAAVAQASEATGLPDSDLGPIPAIDDERLRALVGPLMRDVGAMGIILADRNGRILIDEGATGYVDRERLAAILGPSFGRAADVSPLVGGEAWSMVYYDGDRLDVFGLALGIHYFLCLIFEGSNRGAFGAVNHFGRRAVDQMIDMIGEAAYQRIQAAVLPVKLPPKEERKPAAVPSKMKPVVETEPATDTAGLEAMFEAAASEPLLQPVLDFDVDSLFGQTVDESMADSLFDPDALGDLAASLSTENDERVGYDEAFDMGILDELG